MAKRRMRAWIGLDPGLSGAAALLTEDGGARVWDAPTVEVKRSNGKGVRRLMNEGAMADILLEIVEEFPDARCFIENVHAMPGHSLTGRPCPVCHRQRFEGGQGIVSAFNFGDGFGLWRGMLAALRIPFTRVDPRRWKPAMLDGTPGKDKESSRLRAIQLFPTMSEELARKKDEGRAEALLIAEFGRRMEGCEP